MKLAFIFPIYRTKRTVFDGLPLSTPYLISGLKAELQNVFFEQIDLNNEIALLNKKEKRFEDYEKIIKRVEELCLDEKEVGKMISNRIPGSLILPRNDSVNFFSKFFERLYNELNLKIFDHYFLTSYQIHDQDLLSMLLFAKFLKKKSPHKKIIVGGMRNFTESFKDQLKKIDYVDVLIAGDGVESCKNLIKDMQNNRTVKALYNNPTSKNRKMELPDYSSFRNFANFNIEIDNLKRYYNISIEDKNKVSEKILCLPYLFSKGCFWQNCAYCAGSAFKSDYIHKKVSEVISDIKKLKKQCGTKFFIFYNANFNSNLSFAKRLTSEMINNKLNIIWTDSFNLNVLDNELIELLAKSGCVRMDIGLASSNAKVQKIYNNIIQDDNYQKKLKKINEAGIWVNANVIPNLPFIYDIKKEMLEFKKIVKYIDSVTVNSYRAYRGSDMVVNPEKYELDIIDEEVNMGRFTLPIYFLEKNFKGSIDDRKKLFVDNFVALSNFFKRNNVSTNSRVYYLLCLLYDVYGHRGKNKIKKEILSC